MKFTIVAILICILVACFSCRTMKEKAEAQKRLEELKQEREIELSNINKIKYDSRIKKQQNKLDAYTENIINQRLNEKALGLDLEKRRIDSIEEIFTLPKISKHEMAIVNTLLDSVRKQRSTYIDRLAIYIVLGENLKLTNFSQFSLSAWFPSGKYKISPETYAAIYSSFLPIFDSINKISKRFPERKLKATIVVYGYADGQDYDRSGEIYKILAAELYKKGVFSPTRQDLNFEISELRALELVKVVSEMFLIKSSHMLKNNPNLNIEFNAKGKGEEFPDKTITNYTENDDRRRICYIYWVVVPDAQL